MTQLSTLNKYFWKYRRLFILGILFVILTNYFRILAPQITGYVVNTVVQTIKATPSNATVFTRSHDTYDIIVRNVLINFDEQPFKTKILFAGIILLLLALISGLFMFLMRQTIIVMSRHIEFDQKNEVFSHYQQLDTQFYKTPVSYTHLTLPTSD